MHCSTEYTADPIPGKHLELEGRILESAPNLRVLNLKTDQNDAEGVLRILNSISSSKLCELSIKLGIYHGELPLCVTLDPIWEQMDRAFSRSKFAALQSFIFENGNAEALEKEDS